MTTTAAAGVETRGERIIGGAELQIFVRSWRPTSARGVVVICHGFKSHSGYYEWAAQQLANDGLAVYALDLHGRGQSLGERYYTEHFQDYLDDLNATVRLARSREPGLPIFLLGHSAGGVIASCYAAEHQGELEGLICESFAFQVYAPDVALAVLKGLDHVVPHAHVLNLKTEFFSRDPAVIQRMNDDPYVAHEVQPTRTVAELARADETLRDEIPTIALPLLILHGTEDKAAKPSGSQFFYENAEATDKTLRLYEGHYHDLLNDLGREQVMADITRWIDEHLPSR
jgi:alpha-beta hydrolase superfamily lysophospholipase